MKLNYKIMRTDETLGRNIEDYIVENTHQFVRREVAIKEATIDRITWPIVRFMIREIFNETEI